MSNRGDREATGKDIIEAIVESMVAGLEPMYSKTLAPGLFHVYLREKDYERLQGVFNELQREAQKALDDKLASLNKSARRGMGPILKLLAGKLKPALEKMPEEARPPLTEKIRLEGECVRPDNGWQITFFKNEDEDSDPGDVVIIASLVMPQRPELGGGVTTLSIKTLYREGSMRITDPKRDPMTGPPAAQRITLDRHGKTAASAPTLPATREEAPTGPVDVSALRTNPSAFAVLRYHDNAGDHAFEMNKASLVIGRGGAGVWVDIKLNTLPDVSREHLRIRRDEGTRAFYLKDVSTLGTTIDGQIVPPAMDTMGDRRVDKDVWVRLPNKARIGLASTITIEFEAL